MNKRKEQILFTAREIIEKQGVDKLTMRYLAKKPRDEPDNNNLFIQTWAIIHGLIMLVKQKVVKYHTELAANRLAYL